MVKGIMFDFWGTLVRNGIYSPSKQALSILRKYDLSFSDFIVRFEEVFMKQKYETQEAAFTAVCDEFGIDRNRQIVVDKLIGLWNKNKFTASPYPDTIEFLKEMKEKGIKLMLVTNSDNFSADFVIDKFNMKELFDVIAISCEVGALKTEPELFEWALQQAGLKKEDVIMVGDSFETDIEGAKKAGIKPVLIDRKGRREYEDKVETLAELKKYLE